MRPDRHMASSTDREISLSSHAPISSAFTAPSNANTTRPSAASETPPGQDTLPTKSQGPRSLAHRSGHPEETHTMSANDHDMKMSNNPQSSEQISSETEDQELDSAAESPDSEGSAIYLSSDSESKPDIHYQFEPLKLYDTDHAFAEAVKRFEVSACETLCHVYDMQDRRKKKIRHVPAMELAIAFERTIILKDRLSRRRRLQGAQNQAVDEPTRHPRASIPNYYAYIREAGKAYSEDMQRLFNPFPDSSGFQCIGDIDYFLPRGVPRCGCYYCAC